MKSNVYAVFDIKAGSYSPPFLAQNDPIAMRMLMDVALDSDTQVGRHPQDFRLYRVGEFDHETARFQFDKPQPDFVCEAMAVIPERRTRNGYDNSEPIAEG